MATPLRLNFNLAEVPDDVERKTKIICTIGPKTMDVAVMIKLMEAGMNVVRMNFSHGDHDYHGQVVKNARAASAACKKCVAIMLDTKGPEIRTGKLENHQEIELEAGDTITLMPNWKLIGNKERIGVSYDRLCDSVKIGGEILIDDGLISLKVAAINDDGSVVCTVNNPGTLGETKGVNLPHAVVHLPAITEQDESDILFGVEQGVDFIAASFIRKADDVLHIREILHREKRGRNIKIISKIESAEGLQNFDEILAVSDGIMVARGDLGVEVPIQKVGLYQKMMIRECNRVGKPVVTATQMLESMIKNPRPTRAEATDICNAVFDGTDCVMLSGETAKGDFPLEAVRIMAKICREAEATIDHGGLYLNLRANAIVEPGFVEAVASSAVKTAYDINASLIITLTETGRTSRLVSKYRPHVPILCISSSDQTARQVQVTRGCVSEIVGSMIGTDALVLRSIHHAKEMGLCKAGDIVVVLSGMRDGVAGKTNIMKCIEVQ